MPGGAEAADLVLKIVAEAVDYDGAKLGDPAWWSELLVHADALVQSDRRAGETTCVVAYISTDGGRIVGVSVGDSGAITHGGTSDDLTEGQHKKRRLGSGRAQPAVFLRPTLDGALAVGTDGLFAYARAEVIGKVPVEHTDLDDAAEALVQAVKLPSGDLQDDVAIVLVRVK